MEDEKLYEKLREEMAQTRQRRFQYQLGKTLAIGSFVGIGSVTGGKYVPIFYLIPFVAMAFDLFILGESFTMRRLTAFIRLEKSATGDAELRWEEFVRENPDRMSSLANLVLTLASSFGSFLILIFSATSIEDWLKNGMNAVWFSIVTISLITIRYAEKAQSASTWRLPEYRQSTHYKNPNQNLPQNPVED